MEKNIRLLNRKKKGIDNRIKSLISGLMCTALLVVCVVPVKAGQCMDEIWVQSTFGACGHANSTYTTPVSRYTMINSLTHKKYDYQERICNDCEALLNTYTYDRGEEKHSLSYDDLGHVEGGGYHNYRIKCTLCGFNTVTGIPCTSNGGSHNTP